MLIFPTTDNIDRETCAAICEKFNTDLRNVDGELFISDKEDWKNLDSQVYQKVNQDFGLYLQNIVAHNPRLTPLRQDHEVIDSGYIIRRISGDRWSDWYDDCHIDIVGKRQRVAGFIYYLNAVESGSNLEFIDGTKIASHTGLGVFFPATWTNLHRITPADTDTAIILMGWFYQSLDPTVKPETA